jgi:prepilin-type N-terminal cleavage/methylation domain-containing protein
LSNSRGFTLVELGMVVLLLGLFATLSIPLFYSASDSALHTDARKISTAVRHRGTTSDSLHVGNRAL